jgi:hypothetical protein
MRQLMIPGLVLGLFLVQPLWAQDSATDADVEDPGDASADESTDAGSAADGNGDDDSPEYADDLNDFMPSSEVPPDEQVTFPVDI